MFPIGQVNLRQSWAEYEASWSSNHRKNMRKTLRGAGDSLSLQRHRGVPAAMLPALMEQFADVENRSWKGAAGSSLLESDMMDFLLEQARPLNERSQVEFDFLMLDGVAIAAEFAYVSKGVYQAFKIGYDPEYKHLGPGQLLHRLLFEELIDEGECHLVDMVGPLTDATARWCTQQVAVHNIAIAVGRTTGNLLVKGYRDLWPLLRKEEPAATLKLGAAPAEAAAK